MEKSRTFFIYGLQILFILSLVLGGILTVVGLLHLKKYEILPWASMGALAGFVGFLGIVSFTIIVLTKKFQINLWIGTFLLASLFALGTGMFWPLLITIFLAVSSWTFGYWILGVLKIENKTWVNCFLVGVGIYGTLVGIIAHFPINYPGVYGIALLLPVLYNRHLVVEKSKELFTFIKNNTIETRQLKLDLCIAVIALFYFVIALMPEVGFDSLTMHLFIPGHLALRHAWGFDISNYIFALMPMLGDWIFSIGNMLAGETAVRLINVGFIFTLGWLIREIVLWAGGNTAATRWAILIFLVTPLTFTEGSSLYIESIWATFTILGVFMVLKACSDSGTPKYELPIGGLMLGFALATKAITFMVLPVLFLILAVRYRSWIKTITWKYFTIGVLLFVLVGIIPYATAWWLTGNPVFPFFNTLFQSPYFYNVNMGTPFTSAKLTLNTLYQVTFHTNKFLEGNAGASGFEWLLLFVPTVIGMILFKQKRSLGIILLSIGTISLTFHFQGYLRYIFPFVVLLIIPMGIMLEKTLAAKSFVKYLVFLIAVSIIILNILFINSGNGFYRDFPIGSLFSQTNRENYLDSHVPMRRAVTLLNQLNTERSPVAVFAFPLTAGLASEEFHPAWSNIEFRSELENAHTEQDLANLFFKNNITYIILDSSWEGCCGDSKEKQMLEEKTTDEIIHYGSVSVRRVKQSYFFKNELLTNPDFNSISGWTLGPETMYDPISGSISATEPSPAYQQIAVSPGKKYLNTVVSRCGKEPTIGRVQVNWFSEKKGFLKTDIQTYNCSLNWMEYRMQVIAPPEATSAVVYTNSGTKIPVEFKSNSLRE